MTNMTTNIMKPITLLSHHQSVDLLSLLAGACLTLAFAPFSAWYVSFISLTWLFSLWLNATPWRASWRGLLFGIGFFSTSVSWIFISIHRYGNTNAIIATLITALFVLLLSIAPAITGYLSKRLFPQFNHISSLLGVPSIWVLLEFIRSYVLTGFPWVLLGQSQLHSPLRGFMPILGVYGVSWLCVMISLCLLLSYYRSWQVRLLLFSIVCGLGIIGHQLSLIHWTTPDNTALHVSLVQGNITRENKWDPNHIAININKYQRLTKPLWSNSQLIIWPENAIPIPDTQATSLLKQLRQHAIASNTTLIAGLPIAYSTTYYNGALALGKHTGIYLKRHLVPFGEYVPFGNWLRDIIGFFAIAIFDFASGPIQQAPIMASNTPLAVFICYEIAYAQLVRDSAQQAAALVVLSDDSWFGESIASWQQLQIAQIRALETGRYVLSATNNGQTAVINPQGQIHTRIPDHQSGILQTTFYPMQGTTPWLRLGLWPILFGCGLLLLVGITWQRQFRQRSLL